MDKAGGKSRWGYPAGFQKDEFSVHQRGRTKLEVKFKNHPIKEQRSSPMHVGMFPEDHSRGERTKD